MWAEKVRGRDGEATHNVSERPGGENGARKHGARANATVHDTAGSRTDAAGSRTDTTGSRTDTTGSQRHRHGRKPHKRDQKPHRHGRKPHKRREWRALPCATLSSGLDSWTSCPDYTQMRTGKFPTSHQNWPTSSQVSPKAALATLPPWKCPEAVILPRHLWGSSGWAFSLASGFHFMHLFVCLLLTKNK